MEPRPLGVIIKAAVVAGVFAGLLVAVFHFFLTEPVIERAIVLEEALHQGWESSSGAPVVSREGQRAGLFLGFVIYGLIWALLLGVVYHLVQGRPGTRKGPGRASLVALLVGWSVALFPFLKYPANPPGVGDLETIQQRQLFYLAFIALSIANTLLAVVVHHYLGRSGRTAGSRWRKPLAVGAAYVVGAAGLFLAMPANLDAVAIPADLVTTFRVLSFVGLALFWVMFAGSFAWLVRADRTAGRAHP